MIKVNEIMSLNPHTINANSNLQAACLKMTEKQIRHLPVTDDHGVIVGLISERDLLAVQDSRLSTLSPSDKKAKYEEIKIADFMSRNVITVSPEAGLREAAIYLQRHRIACLPVIAQDKLVGIVTDSDFVEVAINLLEQITDTIEH